MQDDRPKRRWLRWAVAVAGGTVVGLGSAWWALNTTQFSSVVVPPGVWSTSIGKGTVHANAYERGLSARRGLLAMSSQETVYYTAETDNQGRRLSEYCRYRISGGALPARWWSITIYDETDYLAQNADNAHSIDATRMVRNADGTWQVVMSRERNAAPNWLSMRATGHPVLSLRLYNPRPSVLADPAGLPAPQIARLDCEGEA